MKKLSFIQPSQSTHWVGDGFPVRNIFSYRDIAQEMSPFLLLDYSGPKNFSPTRSKRGVGEHPHRGFETVTIVYHGEVEHRDSSGGGGKIGPGDVQWMTAASGLVHEEFHGAEYADRGGLFEVVQLWVNLPAKDKNVDPGYQSLLDADIPSVNLPDGAGKLRVIAGEYNGKRGPAHTFTPIEVWDVRLNKGGAASLTLPEGHTAAVVVLKGTVQVNGDAVASDAQFVLLDRKGGEITLEASSDAVLLVLGGEPIDEPVVMHGPFVMNTADEIRQAMVDFRNGKFGEIAA